VTVLVALLVCLIPTTIGGLLSAIGVAGMSRMMGKNVIATSGRAVEAAGDVDVLMLDKTGTITLGNRQARQNWPSAAQLASLADETPEGRSIVVLAKQTLSICASVTFMRWKPSFVHFSAHTRMSGIDWHGRTIRKGAADSRSASTLKPSVATLAAVRARCQGR
jgi:K+-transporting ATPase ATPase B chain